MSVPELGKKKQCSCSHYLNLLSFPRLSNKQLTSPKRQFIIRVTYVQKPREYHNDHKNCERNKMKCKT